MKLCVGDRVRVSALGKERLHSWGRMVQDPSGLGQVIELPTTTKYGTVKVQWAYGTAHYQPEYLERAE